MFQPLFFLGIRRGGKKGGGRWRWRLVAGALLAGAGGRAWAQAPVIQSGPPSFKLLRYDEDYRYLVDPARRSQWLDPLKYLPLRRGQPEWFLTVGGEVRPFYERFVHQQWTEGPVDYSGYWLLRLMLHTSLELGPRVRVFAELKSGLEAGRDGGPRSIDKDELAVNEAFVEVGLGPVDTGPPAVPDERAGPLCPVVLRLGRQELDYGAGRMVSLRELPNLRQSFDGAKIIMRTAFGQVDAFAVRPVIDTFGAFDDYTDRTESLWAVYAVHPLSKALSLDAYYIGNHRQIARFAKGTAPETRHSVGARLSYTSPAWNFESETIYQAGRHGDGPIRAWGLAFNGAHTFTGARWQPTLRLHGGINSGDQDPTGPGSGTFYPPFPRGAYFGTSGANGPANIIGLAPTLRLVPTAGMVVSGFCFFLWRQSLRDGIYSIPGQPLRPAGQGLARYVGTQPELDVSWSFQHYCSVTASYVYFGAGPYLHESPPGASIHYVGSWFSFKF